MEVYVTGADTEVDSASTEEVACAGVVVEATPVLPGHQVVVTATSMVVTPWLPEDTLWVVYVEVYVG